MTFQQFLGSKIGQYLIVFSIKVLVFLVSFIVGFIFLSGHSVGLAFV